MLQKLLQFFWVLQQGRKRPRVALCWKTATEAKPKLQQKCNTAKLQYINALRGFVAVLQFCRVFSKNKSVCTFRAGVWHFRSWPFWIIAVKNIWQNAAKPCGRHGAKASFSCPYAGFYWHRPRKNWLRRGGGLFAKHIINQYICAIRRLKILPRKNRWKRPPKT